VNEEKQPRKAIKVSGHLEEKRGVYQAVLSWRGNDGQRGRKSVSTGLPVKGNKKRAEDILFEKRKEQEALLAEMRDNPVGGDMIFADFMELWLEATRKKVKVTTFGGYQLNVQKAIAPYFRKRNILLKDLTADDINEFYDKQLERVKAMTVTKFHANISSALKYAVQKGYVPFSIMDKVERPKPERFVGKFLKQSEVIELFEAVKGHKLELGVILGAFYGLRRSEIVGLRWEAIDFEANTITIEHTVTITNLDGKRILVVGDTTKTKSSHRTLPLVPQFREKLLSIKAEQAENRRLCGKMYNKEEGAYIYVDAMGNRIKPDYLTQEFPAFLEKHGFKRMRFHDTRHSAASLLLASGVPLKQIQEWLGHSDFAITANTYAHLEYNSKLNAANAMSWIHSTTLGKGSPEDKNEGQTEKAPEPAENKDFSKGD